MVTTVAPRVEIDDRVRQNRALMAAVTSATEYLHDHLDGVAPPALIYWAGPTGDGSRLALTIADAPDDSGSAASREILARHLTDADPYRRDVFTLQVFSDLLRERSKKSRVRIDELVRRIDFEALGDTRTGDGTTH